jgi:hypothetical protein
MDIRLAWLLDKVARHSNYPELIEDGRWQDWVGWALHHNMIVVNNPPTWGLIARPVSRDLYARTPKEDLLYAFDLKGDSIWVDFLYGPGQWPAFLSWLKSTGKVWGGWQHRETGKVHIVEIARLRVINSPPSALNSPRLPIRTRPETTR